MVWGIWRRTSTVRVSPLGGFVPGLRSTNRWKMMESLEMQMWRQGDFWNLMQCFFCTTKQVSWYVSRILMHDIFIVFCKWEWIILPSPSRLILVFVRTSFVPLVENTRCTSLGIGVGGYIVSLPDCVVIRCFPCPTPTCITMAPDDSTPILFSSLFTWSPFSNFLASPIIQFQSFNSKLVRAVTLRRIWWQQGGGCCSIWAGLGNLFIWAVGLDCAFQGETRTTKSQAGQLWGEWSPRWKGM